MVQNTQWFFYVALMLFGIAACGGGGGADGDNSIGSSHTVTAVAGANGSISPTSVDVDEGGTISFTVTPDSGFAIETVSGCRGSISGNTYTTGTITSPCTVVASFIDNVPPAISNTSPTDGDTDVERDVIVSASYSEDILSTSVDNNSLVLVDNLGNNVSGSVAFDGLSNTVSFTPDRPLALLRRHIATADENVADLSGNSAGTGGNWSFTVRDGQWLGAGLIEAEGEGAVKPQIAIDVDGNAISVWRQVDIRSNIWANRFTPTAGWGTAELIENDNTGNAFNPQIAIDTGGNAISVWVSFDGIRANIWANRFTLASGWDTADLIETDNAASAFNPQAAFDATGNAISVWQQSDRIRANIWANRFISGTGWSIPELIETDNAGAAFDPQIAIDPGGNAISVWTQSDGTVDNIWANRFTPGAGWGTAEPIETDNAGDAFNPQVAVDPIGNAISVWQQSDGSGVIINIWANRFD